VVATSQRIWPKAFAWAMNTTSFFATAIPAHVVVDAEVAQVDFIDCPGGFAVWRHADAIAGRLTSIHNGPSAARLIFARPERKSSLKRTSGI